MHRTILLIIVLTLSVSSAQSQSIQDLMNQVNTSNLDAMIKELSGEEAAIINGTNQTITNRVHSNNDLATTYIQERLEALPNLSVEIQNFNSTGKNVIATQLGTITKSKIFPCSDVAKQ